MQYHTKLWLFVMTCLALALFIADPSNILIIIAVVFIFWTVMELVAIFCRFFLPEDWWF